MADVEVQLEHAIAQLKKQQKRYADGKIPALAATGKSLDKVPIGGRARARGVRIPNVKINLKRKYKASGKKRAGTMSKAARKAAGRKAARTRARNHAVRVRAGKKAARTRARRGH